MTGHRSEEVPARIVLWGVAWRPAAGGSWDILHDDCRPVVFSDPRLAERRVRVESDRNPAFLYQSLPLEGSTECPTCRGDGWVTEAEHGCDGTEAVCLTTCPVPVQAPCSDCSPPKVASTGLCDGEPF